MPPIAPGVTLTANLESILGGGEGGGYLRITLCGFGPVIACVPGTCVIEDAGVPQLVGPQVGSAEISQVLFGNDVIVPGPDTTFYEIAVLDANKNVVQAGLYQFLNGAGNVDLSQAVQIVAPYGFYLPLLAVRQCTGAVPGNTYTAPGRVVMLLYNGTMLFPGAATLGYTLDATQTIATLSFNTEAGDRIDALCIL